MLLSLTGSGQLDQGLPLASSRNLTPGRQRQVAGLSSPPPPLPFFKARLKPDFKSSALQAVCIHGDLALLYTIFSKKQSRSMMYIEHLVNHSSIFYPMHFLPATFPVATTHNAMYSAALTQTVLTLKLGLKCIFILI